MQWLFGDKNAMVTAESALKDRTSPITLSALHPILKTPLTPPYPAQSEIADFALGCFWGAERKYWVNRGVYTTLVGYMGGFTKHPTYEDVCSGRTGHTETVRVVYDPSVISYAELLKVFFESHDPTQGMRQGNDRGTQYRSLIFYSTENQKIMAEQAKEKFQTILSNSGLGVITTEIRKADDFYNAEEYHQQYLHKNPNGYCGLGGTGLSCPI